MSAQPHLTMRSAYLVMTLGFGAIVFEGYDLIIYGAAVPALLADTSWGLTPARVGAIGGAALLGMFVGAPATGWLSDRFGRRKLFIGSLSFFSFMMILVATARTPTLLGLFRFLAGLGFGGIPPTAIALVNEFAPARRKVLFTTIMLAGFGIGGMLAGGLANGLLPRMGFRGLFALGALPLFTIVPLAVWLLPESPSFGRVLDTTVVNASSPWVGVLRGGAGMATVLFLVSAFCVNVVIYALNTWLPQLMRGAGYAIGSALHFLVLLNIGAVVGALSGGGLADRFGGRTVATALFVIAAISLGLLAIPAPLAVTSILVLIAGASALGNQSVLLGYVATHYSDESRATALGVIFGGGRLGAAGGPLLGGLLISAGIGLGGNVSFLAAAAALAAVATFFVPSIFHSRTGSVHSAALDNSQTP